MRVAHWEKIYQFDCSFGKCIERKKMSVKLQNCSLSIKTDQALLLVSGVTPLSSWIGQWVTKDPVVSIYLQT